LRNPRRDKRANEIWPKFRVHVIESLVVAEDADALLCPGCTPRLPAALDEVPRPLA
jgi:hypothetical protein